MKKITALLVLALLLFSCGGAAASTFSLSNQFPASHHLSLGMVFFAEKVKEYSGGKVECKIFDSAQLYKDTEIVEALQDGLVEVGLVPTNKWSGMAPAIDIFEFPFAFRDLSSIKKFLDAGAGEALDKEIMTKGVKNLFWADYGYVQYFNSKRPLKTPADFKGLTMRAFSVGDAEILQALGAAPTVMSSSEMYMALQRNTVDGATTGVPAAVSRKIYEVQKYLTISNYSNAQFVVQANLEWWESLAADEQDAIMKAGKDAEVMIREAIAGAEAEALKVVQDAGLEITTLTPEERAAFVEATSPVRDAYLGRSGDLGKQILAIADSINE